MKSFRFLPVLAALLAMASSASAAELLMFTRAGCPFCVKWEREIEPIYPKTDESKLAPLRKVRTDRPLPVDAMVTPQVRYTPTFILIDNGQELGRFEGYSDDSMFWGNLGMLLRRLDDRTPSAPAPAAPGVLKTTYEIR